MKSKALRFIGLLLFSGLFPLSLYSQMGSIRGQVLELSNQQPLPGVNVIIRGTEKGTATNLNGEYVMEKVPVGAYTLLFSFIGFEKKNVPDVIVKSNKITYLNVALRSEILQGQEISVEAGYFEPASEQSVSLQTLSNEEIRRAPGAREDVSRMLQNLPGVNPTSDDRNDLVVRGGSPSEVLFRIDGFEIPNPNHFGTQGATGGPISMMYTEFVENVEFMAGGFTASYGHKLSGVMDVAYREGNRQGFNGKFDLNFAGVGGHLEGPIQNGKGSFLFGLHRSFLDLMQALLNYGGIPIYSNLQGKMVYDFNPNQQLKFLWLGGDDKIEIEDDLKKEDFMVNVLDTVHYGHTYFRSRQLTIGSGLRSFWTKNFYTFFALCHSYNKFYTDFNYQEYSGLNLLDQKKLSQETMLREADVYDNTSVEQHTTCQFDGNWLLAHQNSLSFGAYLKLFKFDHTIATQIIDPDAPDEYGQLPGSIHVNYHQNLTPKVGGYLNSKWYLSKKIVCNLGARYDYFQLLKTGNLSPRLNLVYTPNVLLALHLGTGRYFQNPEFIYITGDETNKTNLTDIQADHFIAGLNYLLTPTTKFTLEVYHKRYAKYPVMAEPGYEMLSMANSGSQYGSVGSMKLTSQGAGKVSGLELMLQKKLAEKLYGLAAYSYSVIQHKALDGIFRNGAFDNRNVFNLVLGYRQSKSWEFSLKWRYAGGVPYTPYNRAASIAAGDARLDLTQINTARYAPYHRLDLRYDYRHFYNKLTLVTYFSVENVYNRENPRWAYWETAGEKTAFNYQTGLFPVGGVSLEF
ncbi:TonB-dependent receptor [candidate division KSB1 bacterium]|nr:TonB-dependent receptor [candidate division KSB1 bacterium]